MSPRPDLAPSPAPAVVAARVADVRRRIGEAGRDPDAVRLVAVTKGFDGSAVTAALAAGVHDIGENYAAELSSKAASLGDHPGIATDGGLHLRWHFLGAIQRRRVAELAPLVVCWHTLARVVEGESIARRAPGARVFVEVEVSGLPGRNGCAPEAVPRLVRALEGLELDVRGLMVVAPPGPAEVARTAFRTTARLAADLGLRELSMGMSGDLEVALEEGTTMVRMGRALFGPRPGVGPDAHWS
ncbi:MAG TPA: YggS family pyridoxal phosphate enzyme [Acidimicrobiales bacterium]|nr:YggS family pyridoxal phosphate enzyme [Acidimicrobiales bacterium]